MQYFLCQKSISLVSMCPVLGTVLAVLLLIAGGEGLYDHCQHVSSNRGGFTTGGKVNSSVKII